MKTKFNRGRLMFSGIKLIATVVAALLVFNAHLSTALGQGATAFMYQGQLQSNGTNVDGTNGIIFTLCSSATGNSAVGAPITNRVAVANGLFTVNLDYGAGAFNGSARWLDIAVSNGVTNVDLSPRAQILPTPYATFAATAGTATTATTAATATNIVGGVVATGTFSGNGSGLTNVAANLEMQVFSNPGSSTFTVPTNVTSIIVEVWAGGGGGGSGNGSYDVGGGGGGAGGYTKIFYDATPGASYSVLVGSGGIAGAAGGSSGFDGIVLATGGAAGSAGAASGVTSGGLGGNGTGAATYVSSIKGGTGKYGTPDGGGDGGDAPCGGPGGVGNLGYGAEAGHAPGGGGGGGEYTGTAGAAGGNGEVIVYY